jgi:hypothetical protein
MRSGHFHLVGRNASNSTDQIKFLPFGMPKLSGADEGQGNKLKRSFRRRLAIEIVNSSQQCADGYRFN